MFPDSSSLSKTVANLPKYAAVLDAKYRELQNQLNMELESILLSPFFATQKPGSAETRSRSDDNEAASSEKAKKCKPSSASV